VGRLTDFITMKNYNVYSRIAGQTTKNLVGQFSGTSKKEVCSKVASLMKGLFISAYEIGTKQPVNFDQTEQNFENLAQSYFENRISK
jgi:hypothetical protein